MIKIFRKKPKINWKYKSWDEVPIDVSEKIYEIVKDENNDLYDIEFKIISLLTDIPVDDLWNLNVDDVPDYTSGISWVLSEKEIKFPKTKPSKIIKVKDREFSISTDLQDFSISQYIDFQNLWHKWIKDRSIDLYCRILAVFLVPIGKKYTTDYDINEVSDFLKHNLPITTANQIYYFFLISLARSIRATELCYKVMMKMLRMKSKTKEEKEKMKILEMEVERIINQTRTTFGLAT